MVYLAPSTVATAPRVAPQGRDMARASYLKTRIRTHHFRLRIPSDLVPIFGRSEIHRSTKTAHLVQAKAIAEALRARAITTFGIIRHQTALGLDPTIIDATRRTFEDSLPSARCRRQSQIEKFVSLESTIDDYLKDRQHVWTPKTLLMSAASLKLFGEVLGDRRLDTISRQDCRKFRDLVLKLPPNMTKRFKNYSIDEIVAVAAKPMSAKNANKIVSSVSAFFNWMVREDLLKENPARGLRVRIRHSPDTERNAFSESDLKVIFELSPIYAGCHSVRCRDKSGALIIKDSKFWLPLIALYSGMRLEEIAQLHTRDVRQVEGVWIFDIRGSETNKLKTPQSQRQVPIHPVLLEVGLIDYCTKLASGHMWPDLGRSSDGFYSSRFSKWFGRYKRRIGIDSPKLTFHSFRHTVINYLKQEGVEEALIKELVGHGNESITMSRYGKRLNGRQMLTVVERLQYGIDLSELTKDRGHHH